MNDSKRKNDELNIIIPGSSFSKLIFLTCDIHFKIQRLGLPVIYNCDGLNEFNKASKVDPFSRDI